MRTIWSFALYFINKTFHAVGESGNPLILAGIKRVFFPMGKNVSSSVRRIWNCSEIRLGF